MQAITMTKPEPEMSSLQERMLNALGMARARRELRVMRLLDERGSMTFGEIRVALNTTEKKLSTVLNGLVKDELIGYVADGNRRRYYLRGID